MGRAEAASGYMAGTRGFKEWIARQGETFFASGHAPAGLEDAFASMKKWMGDVYTGALDSPIKDRLSPEAHALFRYLLGEEVGPGGVDNIDATAASIASRVNTLVSQGTPFDEAATQATLEHLNLSRISAPDNVAALIAALEKNVTQPVVDTADGDVRSLGQTKMRALSLLGDQAKLIDWANANADEIATIDSKLVALKMVRNALTAHLGELSAQRAADQHSGPGDALAIEGTMRALEQISVLTSRIQRGLARGVSAGRVKTESGAKVQDALNAFTAGLQDMKNLGEALRKAGADVPDSSLISLLNDPERGADINAAIKDAAAVPEHMPRLIRFLGKQAKSGSRKALDMYLEFRGAALLSGARTFDANVLGNVINTVLKPLNQIVGGARTLNPQMMKSGLGMYWQIGASMFDFISLAGTDTPSSVAMAGRSAMQNKPLIDAVSEARPAAIPAWLGGGLVRLPFRGLQGADEFFKQINYRAAVRQRTIDQMNSLPDDVLAKMTTQQRKQAVVEAVKNAVGTEGQAVLDAEGNLKFPKEMQYAREAAYQQDPGPWTEAVLKMADSIPLLRIPLPFIRVPANILGTTWNHTPGLNLLREQYVERLRSSDPYVRAEARGEMITGGIVVAAGAMLAAMGKTTGGGPIDPKRRKALTDTGWQPYSFVTENPDGTKSYTSYMRLEPFGPLLGLTADFADIAGNLTTEDSDRIADAAVVSVARNVTDKTYLKGMADVLKFLDPNQPAFMPRFVASHIPAAVGSTNAAWDDAVREPRTIMEAVKAKIPYLSDQVSPKRDLLGQPVTPPAGYVPFFDTTERSVVGNLARTLSPIATNTSTTDEAKLELARLKYPFSRPSPGLGGLDLRSFKNGDQTAYDRMLEITGEVRLGGKDISTALNDLVASSKYQKLPEPDGVNDAENPRVMQIKQVLSRYYEAAQIGMLKEFPEIRKLTKDALKTERTGNPYGSDLLEHLQKSNY